MSPASIPPTDTLGTSASRGSALTVLSHPLPAGMRDLLPDEAESQGLLVGRVLETFELHGFLQVSLPAFEYAEVLERGLGAVEASTMLRFVEPESGEVVALRPDMTPQVARLVVTRLPDGPFPLRLSYRGSVLRRRHERARHDQQLLQAGIELIGSSGPDGDLEVLEATLRAVRDAGLPHFVLDLGHGAIATELLADVAPETKSRLLEALSQKDQAELVRRAEAARLPSKTTTDLSRLVELQGGGEVFERAERDFRGSSVLRPIRELAELHRAVVERGLAPGVVVDLGETRSVAYYTGPMFQVLAEGPGQAVASGGRYDSLLAAFSRDLPAAGAAIQIDHLAWALGGDGHPRRARALVIAEAGAEVAAQSVVTGLRASKIPSVVVDSDAALDYARAFRYSHLVRLVEADSIAGPRVRLSEIGSTPASGSEASAAEAELGVMSLSSAIDRMRG